MCILTCNECMWVCVCQGVCGVPGMSLRVSGGLLEYIRGYVKGILTVIIAIIVIIVLIVFLFVLAFQPLIKGEGRW